MVEIQAYRSPEPVLAQGPLDLITRLMALVIEHIRIHPHP